MSDSRDLAYALGFVTWRAIEQGEGAWASNRLLRAVLAEPRLRRVLVVDPPRSAAVLAKRLGGAAPALPVDERVGHAAPLRLRRRDPASMTGIARTYRAWDRSAARAAARRGLERPAVVTNSPLVAAYAPLAWAGRVTYYATDDWPAHPALRRWQPVYAAAHARIRERGHAVCAVSEELLRRIAPTGPAAVVPNGVDPAEWREPPAPPPWFAALPRPRILYVGTLDRRIDAAAVHGVAERFPGSSVALVGGGRDEAHLAPLLARANVHAHPSLSRRELAGLVAAADVGIVPHARTALTEAMSPLKLYEYLAAGLPVAAVDLPPMRGVDGRVVLGETGAAFADAVAAALELGPAPEAERREFIEANAWARRHERILALALGG